GTGITGPVGVIEVLVLGRSSDAVVLDAGLRANTLGVLERLHVILIQVEADVAIVFAIVVIGGIPNPAAPDQARGGGIASKGSHAGRSVQRSMDAEQRLGIGVFDAVRIDQE